MILAIHAITGDSLQVESGQDNRFLRSTFNRQTKIASVTAPDIDVVLRR